MGRIFAARSPVGATRASGGTGVVLACGLAVFLVAADMNIVAVALPELVDAFDAAQSAVKWVTLGYSLPMVALILPCGLWARTVSRRKAFTLALLGFGAASALVAAMPSLQTMVAARGLQAVFAAMSSALIIGVVAQAVRPEQLGRAMGTIGVLGPLGGALGPAIGGLLVGSFGWRGIFLINVPICLLAAALGLRYLPYDDGGLRWPRPGWLASALVLASCTSLLVIGLNRLGVQGWPWQGFTLLAAAAALGALWARLPDSRPVRALFADHGLVPWLVVLLFGSSASAAVTFLAPFLLDLGFGVRPQITGITLLILPAAMAVFARIGGALGDRWGLWPVAVLGNVTLLAGVASMVTLTDTGSPIDMAWRLALAGTGLGLQVGPGQAAIMRIVTPALSDTAGTASALLLNLGFAVGAAVASVAWELAGSAVTDLRAAFAAAAVLCAVAVAATVAGRRGLRRAGGVTRP